MPKHLAAVAAAALAVGALIAACGSPAATSTTTTTTTPPAATSPAQTSSTDSTAKPGSVSVTKQGGTITLKGSGAAETEALTLDQAYYIVKVTLGTGDFNSVTVTEKGRELPSLMAVGAGKVGVFRPKSKSVPLVIDATGDYTIELGAAVPLTPADAMPKKYSGGAGTLVTGAVSVPAGYVQLKVEYKGTPDPKGSTGMMLATAVLYDAETGLEIMNPVYVNKAKTEDKAGLTRSKAGTAFLIIEGASAADTWEVTLSKG